MEEGRSGPEMVRVRTFGGGTGAVEGAGLEMVAGGGGGSRAERCGSGGAAGRLADDAATLAAA